MNETFLSREQNTQVINLSKMSLLEPNAPEYANGATPGKVAGRAFPNKNNSVDQSQSTDRVQGSLTKL